MTRQRWWIVWTLFFSIAINYINRRRSRSRSGSLSRIRSQSQPAFKHFRRVPICLRRNRVARRYFPRHSWHAAWIIDRRYMVVPCQHRHEFRQLGLLLRRAAVSFGYWRRIQLAGREQSGGRALSRSGAEPSSCNLRQWIERRRSDRRHCNSLDCLANPLALCLHLFRFSWLSVAASMARHLPPLVIASSETARDLAGRDWPIAN